MRTKNLWTLLGSGRITLVGLLAVALAAVVSSAASAAPLLPNDPGLSGNLKTWLDANDPSTIFDDGNNPATSGSFDGNVAQWQDKSGNAKHVTQGSASGEPAYATGGFGATNRASVRFDGSNDSLQAAVAGDWTFMNDGSDFTVFVMSRLNSDHSSGAGIGNILSTKGGSSTIGFGMESDDRNVSWAPFVNAMRVQITRGTTGTPRQAIMVETANNSLPVGVANMVNVRHEAGVAGNDLVVGINRSSAFGAEPVQPFNTGAPQTPLLLSTPSSSITLDGNIAEVIIYDRALSTAEIGGVEEYLALKYVPPMAVPGLKMWLPADGINPNDPNQVRSGSAFVKNWIDQSGNNNNATQGSDASQPEWIGSGPMPTGKPVVRFDGDNDFMSLTGAVASTLLADDTKTVFIVGSFDSTAAEENFSRLLTARIPPGNSRYGLQMKDAPGDPKYGYFGSVEINGPPITPGEFDIITTIQDGSTGTLRVMTQGFEQSAGGFITFGTVDGATLGAVSSGGGFLNGDIAEVIIYDRALSADEIAFVEEYLFNRHFVPEPSTCLLFSIGLIGLAAFGRRRKGRTL